MQDAPPVGKRARRRAAVSALAGALLAALAMLGVLPQAVVQPVADAAGAVAEVL